MSAAHTGRVRWYPMRGAAPGWCRPGAARGQIHGGRRCRIPGRGTVWRGLPIWGWDGNRRNRCRHSRRWAWRLLVLRDGHVDAAIEHFDRACGGGVDVEIENLRGQPQRGTGIGHVHHAADMALHRCGAEDGVRLRAAVAKLLQVLDGVQAGLAVGDGHVQVMLFTRFVYRDAFKDQIVLVAGGDRAGLEDRIFDAVLDHAAFDQADLHVYPASHLDCTAEGDFAVALTEVQVADRQARPFHIYRKVHLGATRQILDVAVAAM